MTQQTPNPTPENEQPIIPPIIFPVIALIGIFLALFNASAPGGMTVIGYAGLGFAILALLAWVLIAPKQVLGLLTGRTARFGGTSLLVTLLVIVVAIGLYAFVRGQNIRVDLTESDQFSLTEESRDAIANIGADPTVPRLRINAFFTTAQAAQQDRYAPLFEDYQTTSGGKVEFAFIDPERNPTVAEAYEITRSGQVVITPLNDAGEPDTENAEVVQTVDQGEITNAILKAAAQGDFRAYFIPVENGVGDQMTVLKQFMSEQFDWTVIDDRSLLELSTNAEQPLNDPNADAELMIIPGGTAPLTDEELTILQNYVAGGGSLIIFAASGFNEDGISLATADNLNAYLRDSFGVSFANNLVLDQTQQAQSPLVPFATDFDTSSFITTNGIPTSQAALVVDLAVGIQAADAAPANVIVTPLVRSGTTSYAKTNLADLYAAAVAGNGLTPEQIAQAEGDATGPFVLAASAENMQTGARLVLFSTPVVGTDDGYMIRNSADNFPLAYNSAIWTTRFDEFFSQITVVPQQRPQDAPVSADVGTLNNIRILTVFVLPFGILLIGVWVWWSNRERAR
jgi:ABC-type uncharacterized transport system involved in gliding motility auxiliary subunit